MYICHVFSENPQQLLSSFQNIIKINMFNNKLICVKSRYKNLFPIQPDFIQALFKSN